MKPIDGLYHEALEYMDDHHYRIATDRLRMLLAMAPDNTPAMLLLAKIHVVEQKWRDALGQLDHVESLGGTVPKDLRRAVEDHLRAESAAQQEKHSAGSSRIQGELQRYKQEAQELRKQNAMLRGQASTFEREANRWAWATSGVCAMAMLFIFGNLFWGGPSSDETDLSRPMLGSTALQDNLEAPTLSGTDLEEALALTNAPEPEMLAALANQIVEAIKDDTSLVGTNLQVRVDDNLVTVTGVVDQFQQRQLVEDLTASISNRDVNIDDVSVLAITKGTTHTVQSGDSFSHIAQLYYGDSTLSGNIAKANRKTGGRAARSLQIGDELTIPAVE
jgi:nucleoid-associated protein YgaU